MLKKVLSFSAIVLLIASCGTKSVAPKAETKFSVPIDCLSTKILTALPADIPNPKWIDTKWNPAPNTDLYNVLNSGGIACSFGNQNMEVGATILWAPSELKTFESMAKNWSMSKVEIPGVSEEIAYWLGNEASGADGMHRWTLNFLYKGNWIQINASYIYSMDDALPLINAAIESLNRG
ncbi:MAG: hypothetical protein RLZ57_452 [Actinomycetota bacterium]|jgi:hypothetical protein